MHTWRSTLRWKLTTAFLLWTAAIQSVTAVVFVVSRELWVKGFTDAQLRAAVPLLKRSLEADVSWPPGLEQAVFDMQSDSRGNVFGIRLCAKDADGQVLATWPSNIAMDANTPLPEIDLANANNASFETIRMTGLAMTSPTVPVRFRGARTTVRTVGGASYTLVLGNSLEIADGASMLMLKILLAALSLGLVGAGVAGWIVAGRSTRRLLMITDAVQRVSPSRLIPARDLPTDEDEIGQMGTAVNAMLARLASAFRAQEHFISNVSHELKTPIATLLSEAQVLKSSAWDSTASREFPLSVEEECRKMSSLIETLLALARIGEGAARSDSTCSLNDLAVDAVQRSDKIAQLRNVSVSPSLSDESDDQEEPVVKADADLLRIAVDNLIRNAVQVSPAGSRVEVSVGITDGHGVIRVSDRGPGIPADFVDRMFDRFSRQPDRTVGTRGTGLGLYIARSLAQMHGGGIEFANRDGGGATFTLKLPLTDQRQ